MTRNIYVSVTAGLIRIHGRWHVTHVTGQARSGVVCLRRVASYAPWQQDELGLAFSCVSSTRHRDLPFHRCHWSVNLLIGALLLTYCS